MRIAITVDPDIPVPPREYGGIERVVNMLVHGLLKLGHEVILLAHPDSSVPCKLIPLARSNGRSFTVNLGNTYTISRVVLKERVDLVHSFGRLIYLTPLLLRGVPIVMTYQRYITPRSIQLGCTIARRGRLLFTGVSRKLISRVSSIGEWHVVHNGAPADVFSLNEEVKAEMPLIFLGRIEEIKGVHLAIETAKMAKRNLVIAGNVPEHSAAQKYFEEKVKPSIDGKTIRYVGAVNDREKASLLRSGSALLMPILWDEPFGIVMAEALACGTPIIGFNRGSIPEVVSHGINGFICEDQDEMVRGIGSLSELSRADCRRIYDERFSDDVIVGKYETLYKRLVLT